MLSPEKSKSASKSKNQQATGQAESTSFGISGQAARHSPGCSGHGLLIRDSLGSGLGHRHSVALAHPTSGAANVCHLWDLIPPQVRPWADFLGLVPKIPRVGPNWGGYASWGSAEHQCPFQEFGTLKGECPFCFSGVLWMQRTRRGRASGSPTGVSPLHQTPFSRHSFPTIVRTIHTRWGKEISTGMAETVVPALATPPRAPRNAAAAGGSGRRRTSCTATPPCWPWPLSSSAGPAPSPARGECEPQLHVT